MEMLSGKNDHCTRIVARTQTKVEHRKKEYDLTWRYLPFTRVLLSWWLSEFRTAESDIHEVCR